MAVVLEEGRLYNHKELNFLRIEVANNSSCPQKVQGYFYPLHLHYFPIFFPFSSKGWTLVKNISIASKIPNLDNLKMGW